MGTQRVGRATGPELLSATKRTRLCAEYARLDEERLDLDRQSRARGDAMKRIQDELQEQLRLDDAAIATLPRWEFGVELVSGSLYYKGELMKELGVEEFERRLAAAPQREKFFMRAKEAKKAEGGRRRAEGQKKKPAA